MSPPPRNPARVLILRGGAVGDFIVTLPALTAIATRWPQAHRTLAAHPRLRRLALAGGHVHAFRSLDDADFGGLFAEAPEGLSPALRNWLGGFDAAVSFLHDPPGAVMRTLARAGIAHVLTVSPIIAAGHAADALAGPLRAWDCPVPDVCTPCLRLPPEVRAEGARRLAAYGPAVATLHPGSGSRAKNWPTERYLELARRLRLQAGLQPVFVLGEADGDARAMLTRANAEAWPVLPPSDLADLAAVLASARVHVGNDSGITHLAAAVGTPVVALFGPSDPAVWEPRGARARIVRAVEATTAGLASLAPETVLDAVRAAAPGLV